jgi:hypothetical protein
MKNVYTYQNVDTFLITLHPSIAYRGPFIIIAGALMSIWRVHYQGNEQRNTYGGSEFHAL